MRFRFGRGLTLLRGGNSGTSKIGEDVLYITGLEKGLRKWNSVECFDQEWRICVRICSLKSTQVAHDVVVSLQK